MYVPCRQPRASHVVTMQLGCPNSCSWASGARPQPALAVRRLSKPPRLACSRRASRPCWPMRPPLLPRQLVRAALRIVRPVDPGGDVPAPARLFSCFGAVFWGAAELAVRSMRALEAHCAGQWRRRGCATPARCGLRGLGARSLATHELAVTAPKQDIADCEDNLVLPSPPVERPPTSGTAATPGPFYPTAGAGHPTRSQARSLGGHTGSSPRGAHRPSPVPGRTRAPRVLCVGARLHRLTLPPVPRATACGPRRAEHEPFRSISVSHPHAAPQRPHRSAARGCTSIKSTQPCHKQTPAMRSLEALSIQKCTFANVPSTPIEGGPAILQHGIAATAERQGKCSSQSRGCSGSACKANTTCPARWSGRR